MTISKRVLLAAIASALTVATIAALLWIFPTPVLGRVFIAAGYPLAYLIFQATPESTLRELAPQGGPDAVAWAFAIGSLITWFVLLFVVWFVLIGRMRSNPPVNTDARDVPAPAKAGGARAGYRAR